MSPQKRTILLAIGGLVLLTNPLWLFPHEGTAQYTYERSDIAVENGTFEYDGEDLPGFAEENSLNPVGCQPHDDDQPRACAFDLHLVTRDPVTVPGRPEGVFGAEFVRLDGTYYRRIHRVTGSGGNYSGTHDVEPVTPQTILAESAVNISGHASPVSDDLRLEFRIAVTGDSVTSFEDLDENDLGNVYRQNESYYTVVATNQRFIDHGLTFLRYELSRFLLMGIGFVLFIGALFVRTRESN